MRHLNLFDNDLHSENPTGSGIVSVLNGEYQYVPDFLSGEEGERYFRLLKEEILWRQESMRLYGKLFNFPRLTAWYGDPDKKYSYSGNTFHPEPWTNTLLEIKQKVELCAQHQFNSVLLNRYRHRNDSISWHSDSEKELGMNPVIASLNLGATRKFQLRHIGTKQKIELLLTQGSLLIMQGELQHFWEHQVPKTSRPVGERINLTFRTIY